MEQWTAETSAIISAHNKDFNSSNFPQVMKTAAGFKDYLNSVGGVFALWADRDANVHTVTELQQISEFGFGVMALYGFDYENGKTRHRWGKKPTPDAFYLGAARGKCNWGTLSELCTVKAKTTNCNYGIDALFLKAGLFDRSGPHNSSDPSQIVKAFGHDRITKKADLRPGDLIQMYRKAGLKSWYHVVMVGEVTDDSIVCYDAGSRFVENRKYKYTIPKTGAALGGAYSNCASWQAVRVRDIIEDKGMQKTIDLSEHNSPSINWQKVKATGYGVILRMGLRGSMKKYPEAYGKIRLDNHFNEYIAGVKAAGIPYGVYWFPTPITEKEAKEEAAYIIKKIKDYGLSLSFPVFLDSEMVDKGNGRADKLSREKRTQLLAVMCEDLLAAGIPCGVYASTPWLDNNLDMADIPAAARANTWVAQYASKCTYGGISAMWQYTSKGSVPGIPGNVDMSLITGDFKMSDKKTYRRETYVETAQKYIGVVGGTQAQHQIIDIYNSYGAAHGYPRGYKVQYSDAWCAVFVSAMAIKCGYTAIIPVECGCPQMISIAKSWGIWKESDTYKPEPGDLVLYDWQDSGTGDNTGTPDHIGIVEDVTGGYISVIEGNYNDRVQRRALAVGGRFIRGFICPKYTDSASKPSGNAQLVSITADYRVLRKGMKGGKDIAFMQRVVGAKEDEDFGNKTFDRLVEYQKSKGVAVIGQPDGVCGRKTWPCIIADSRK